MSNTEAVVLLLVALIGTIPGWLSWRTAADARDQATAAKDHAAEAVATTQATGERIDGRMSELLAAAKGTARAEGTAAGREEGRAEEAASGARAADASTAGIATGRAQEAEVNAALARPPNGAAAAPLEVTIAGQDAPVEVVKPRGGKP